MQSDCSAGDEGKIRKAAQVRGRVKQGISNGRKLPSQLGLSKRNDTEIQSLDGARRRKDGKGAFHLIISKKE